MKDFFVFLIIAIAVGASLYTKYLRKKNANKSGGSNKPESIFSSQSKDDDYEPYSKK